LHQLSPIELGAHVLNSIRDRNNGDASQIEDVIFGCVEPVNEQGGNIGRSCALKAGFPHTVPGVQINRFCGSGLEAVNWAASKVMAQQAELVVGGGVEMMSKIPFAASGGPYVSDPDFILANSLVSQGISADIIATKYGFGRADVDEYAYWSQKRAVLAWESGAFSSSVIPIYDRERNLLLSRDEHIRPGVTLESLAKLKPAFEELGHSGSDQVALARYPDLTSIDHVHHAGNSSGIVDGAAAVLVGSQDAASSFGLRPRAAIRAFASVGSDPCIMLDGTGAAARLALDRAGMTISDIDLFEVNEAFAAVVLRFMQELNVSHDKVNVNGGSIAMGHPLGATGAMLVGTLLDELEARNLRAGMVVICVGIGMAVATIIERTG
jgi:acetyl-CoA C-acetyltransferase